MIVSYTSHWPKCCVIHISIILVVLSSLLAHAFAGGVLCADPAPV